jgi:uncharacterized membrane protein YfcA
LGLGDGLLFGRWRGRSQSLLSKRMALPRKAPYLAPAFVWLLGFFIVVAFAGRGKLSWLIGALSTAYVLLLPTYLLASLAYNFLVRPKNYRKWEQKFLCLQCGAVVVPLPASESCH